MPIACEVDENGEPYLPVFLQSRIWIDFRTPEAVNENWERLVRHLFGRPAFEKPAVGKPPVYLDVTSSPSIAPAQSRFSALKQAVIAGRPGIRRLRADFLDHVCTAIDDLRTRERPHTEVTGHAADRQN